MAHGGAWYVKPSDNFVVSAPPTPTWSTGTPDTDFPLANALTLDPGVVAKSNENTASFRLTFGAAKTLVGLAYINVSFPGIAVTLSNNAGMTPQVKTVAAPEDNLSISVYFDLTGVANTNATQWTLAVVGSRPVAIGTVIAVEAWTESRMRWDYEQEFRYPVIEHRTGYQKRLQYWIPTCYRKFTGTPFYPQDRAALRSLMREAHGSIGPWLFVQDMNDGEASALVQFGPDTHTERYTWFDGTFDADDTTGIVERPWVLEEVSNGVALF